MNVFVSQRYSMVVIGFLLLYIIAWTTVAYLFDPTVPTDAVEALNWAINGEFGSPKNPYVVGAAMAIGQLFLPFIPLALYWYLSHFVGVAVGMFGVWLLSKRLFGNNEIALFSFMSLNLAGIINFDIIPYNDNYLLVMLWPYLFLFFIKAIYDNQYYWLPLGVVAGLAAMSKYSTFAFLPFMLIYTLWVPAARKAYKSPVIYLAIVLFLLLLLPNALWLYKHDYAAFHWVISEINRGFNRDAVAAVVSIYYPAVVLIYLLLRRNGKLVFPSSPEKNTVLFVYLPPIVLIVTYFTFHSGARPTEWLQPFAILTPVVLISFLNLDRVKALRQVTYLFAGISVVILSAYTLILQKDIRGAGTKFSYIKNVGNQIDAMWHEEYHQPLKYVGGSLAQWMTFYSPNHPRITTRWSNEAKPNVYNSKIDMRDIYENGVLFIGRPGSACGQTHFEQEISELPGITIAKKQEYSCEDEHGRRVTICLGFSAPHRLISARQKTGPTTLSLPEHG